MIVAVAFTLSLFAQEGADDKVLEADRLIHQLRGPLAERRDATDQLLKLRRASHAVNLHLRDKLELAKDPLIRARLAYIVEALILEELWTREENAAPPTVTLAADDRETFVYLAGDARTIGIELKTGDRAFEFAASGIWTAAPIILEKKAFFLTLFSTGPALKCINFADRKEAAMIRGANPGAAGMATTRDRVFALLSGKMFRVDPEKPREKLWEFTLNDDPFGLAASGNTCAAISRRGTITAIDAATGKKAWTANGPMNARLFGNATGYVAASLQLVEAFSADTGRKLWSRPFQYAFSECVDRYVITVSHTQEVECLDVLTGATCWRRMDLNARAIVSKSGQWKMPTPPFAGRHVIFLLDGRLQFVNLATGATEGEFQCDRGLMRGLCVSPRHALVFHGSNKMTALRVAD